MKLDLAASWSIGPVSKVGCISLKNLLDEFYLVWVDIESENTLISIDRHKYVELIADNL